MLKDFTEMAKYRPLFSLYDMTFLNYYVSDIF